jgi:predicted ATPase
MHIKTFIIHINIHFNTTYKMDSIDSYSQILKDSTSIILIGKRGVGKTQCIKNILEKNHWMDTCVIFSPESVYDDCVPAKTRVIAGFDVTTLAQIIECQKQNTTNKLMIVLDNCICSESQMSSAPFRELFINRRQYNIRVIMSIPYPIAFDSDIKNQFDVIMAYKNDNPRNQHILNTQYFEMISSSRLFSNMINSLCKYECLVSKDNHVNTFQWSAPVL